MPLYNYNPHLEDRAYLQSLPWVPMKNAQWLKFSRPAEVTIDWHKDEDQLQIGSCQGNGLTSVLERLASVKGRKVQLSRIFAYLATQRIDGLLGSDSGSTISGGSKLATSVGCPLESVTGYPRTYPGKAERDRILSSANYKAAEEYKANSAWQVSRDYDELLDFIGGGGGVSFGISYGSSTIPRDRVIRQFYPGRGGHAMCVLGYTRDGDLRAINSHGDGAYLITPTAWKQMLAHPWTSAIGLMGTAEPIPVNWYADSPYYKMQLAPEPAEVAEDTLNEKTDSIAAVQEEVQEEFNDDEIG
jgi:hypothetical protein